MNSEQRCVCAQIAAKGIALCAGGVILLGAGAVAFGMGGYGLLMAWAYRCNRLEEAAACIIVTGQSAGQSLG